MLQRCNDGQACADGGLQARNFFLLALDRTVDAARAFRPLCRWGQQSMRTMDACTMMRHWWACLAARHLLSHGLEASESWKFCVASLRTQANCEMLVRHWPAESLFERWAWQTLVAWQEGQILGSLQLERDVKSIGLGYHSNPGLRSALRQSSLSTWSKWEDRLQAASHTYVRAPRYSPGDFAKAAHPEIAIPKGLM